MITLFLGLLFTYVTLSYIKHLFDAKRYPPGPLPLPIIGNMHLLDKQFHVKFYKLAKIYGDVFSFSMGMQRYVIVNGIEAAKDALVTKGSAFAGRDTRNYAFKYFTNGFSDIVFTDYGPYWIAARKLAHSAMNIYGDGKNKFEEKIVKQYEKLCARLSRKSNEPVDLPGELGLTVINVICRKVFNRDYELDDPEFQKILQWSERIGEIFMSRDIFVLGHMPILHIFPLKCLQKIKKAKELYEPMLYEILGEHERTFNSENIRDLTDAMINMNTCKGESIDRKQFSRTQLMMIMSNLIFAGFDTTWKTLHWCVLYLLYWPKYQDLMYDELIAVLGERRYPSIKDRYSFPMVQAVIEETLRLSSVAYLAVPHKAMEDSFIDGKPVPKDTPVLFNIWAINNNEEAWHNPGEFNPYRWIDENGMFNSKKHQSFLPFSAGKRTCLGESMARMELFLFLACLIRDFEICPNPDEPHPSMIAKVETFLTPDDFHVILNMRD